MAFHDAPQHCIPASPTLRPVGLALPLLLFQTRLTRSDTTTLLLSIDISFVLKSLELNCFDRLFIFFTISTYLTFFIGLLAPHLQRVASPSNHLTRCNFRKAHTTRNLNKSQSGHNLNDQIRLNRKCKSPRSSWPR